MPFPDDARNDSMIKRILTPLRGRPSFDRITTILGFGKRYGQFSYNGAPVYGDPDVDFFARDPRNNLAKNEFNQAWELARARNWGLACIHAERALKHGGVSEESIALLVLLCDRLEDKRRSEHYLRFALDSRGTEFQEKVREKYRDFSLVFEEPQAARQRAGFASMIILSTLLALTALAFLGSLTIPTGSDFSTAALSVEHTDDLLRKLSATILVYFMQFGFIAFEAGTVRQSYRRQSAVKNLAVFAVAFMSYIFLGWRIQRGLNPLGFASLLDVAFNAGFASTVALIIANTITERGTLLVNSLCSIVAAGLAYPGLAGLALYGAPFATKWGFVDTAGGSVVHLLGGMCGLSAALWIGPRSKRRAWFRLGKVQTAEPKDHIPLTVIGAFFLWFGWLGFNSGNAANWDEFLLAFTNTNVGASAGGFVGLTLGFIIGLIITVSNKSIGDLSRAGVLREIANLDRIVLGMMGGLVAVTANASLVKPWQAFIEAMLGASVAIVGSAAMVHWKERLDDPLGAIATHGFAGVVGVLSTAIFRHDLCSLGVQASGCLIVACVGLGLATIPCGFLSIVEHFRRGSEHSLYGKLLRLTPHAQQTGQTGTEFWAPVEDIERARARMRAGPPSAGGDQAWIEAIRVLALSEKTDAELPEMFAALDRLLDMSYQGGSDEQTALAAIAARADVSRLAMCVRRILAHRSSERVPDVLEWEGLDPLYRETLIMTISQLAESFAAEYRVLRVVENPTKLRDMVEGFVKACEILREIGEEKGRKGHAWDSFQHLVKLPWYNELSAGRMGQ